MERVAHTGHVTNQKLLMWYIYDQISGVLESTLSGGGE